MNPELVPILKNYRAEMLGNPAMRHIRIACAALKSLGWAEKDHWDPTAQEWVVQVDSSGLSASVRCKELLESINRAVDG